MLALRFLCVKKQKPQMNHKLMNFFYYFKKQYLQLQKFTSQRIVTPVQMKHISSKMKYSINKICHNSATALHRV